MSGDASYPSVVLHLKLDGANGSTVVTDTGPLGKAITVFGDAQLSTSGPLYGTASGLFDGAGDWLRAPQSADFQIFGGDFTVEVSANYASSIANQCLIQFDSAVSTNRANISIVGGLIVFFTEVGGDAASRIIATAPSNGATHEIKLTKSGSTITLWSDGTSLGTTNSTVLPTGNLYCSIGSTANVGGTQHYAGKLDEIRITKGVDRSGSFTAPSYPDYTVDITGDGTVTLDITAAATGAHGVAGSGAVTLDLSADADGTFFDHTPIVGDGAVTLGITAAATGAHGVAGSGAVTLDLSADATAGHGVVGDAGITLSITAAATGAHGVAGVGDVTLDITAAAVAVHPRYELRGEVRFSGVLVNRQVRAYRRDTGELVGDEATVAGRFHIDAGFAEREHYIVPVHLDDAATDWSPPTANRVLSVLALDD